MSDILTDQTSLILPCSPSQYHELSINKEAAPLRQDVEILFFNIEESSDKIGGELTDRLKKSGKLKNGQLLVRSPYNLDRWELQEDAAKSFALEKQLIFSTFCSKLGARQVKVESVEGVFNGKKLLSSLQATAKGLNAEASFEQETSDDIRAGFELEDTFLGGDPDIVSAAAYMEEMHIWSDASMTSLLEMRKSITNKIVSRRLVVSLTAESKRSLSAALKVSAIVPVAGGGGSFSTESKQITDLRLSYLVTF